MSERITLGRGGRGAERADDLRAGNRRGQDQVRGWESGAGCAPSRSPALTTVRRGRLIGRWQRAIHKSSGGSRYADRTSPHRLYGLAAFAAMAAPAALGRCSSDSALDPGGSVADSEIDQTVASDVGESFADDVSQFQENESFEENLSGGSSTFMAGRSGARHSARIRRTVTCDGPDASGWFGCVAYTGRGLTITRQVRFWSGGSFALGWSRDAHRFREPSLDAHGHVRVRGEARENVLDPRGGHRVDGGDARHTDLPRGTARASRTTAARIR